MFPLGLHNAAETIGHLVVQHMIPSPMSNEFVGVIKHVAKSFHNLLEEELESLSGSDSSRGSHHPSHECFMIGTPEGHVKSIREEEATPTNNLDDEVEGGVEAPPRVGEQLRA